MGEARECGQCGHEFPTIGLRIHHEEKHNPPHEPAKEPTVNICPVCALNGHLVILVRVGVSERCTDCLTLYPRRP